MTASSIVPTIIPAASINASAKDLLNSEESRVKYGTLGHFSERQSPDVVGSGSSSGSSASPVIEFLIIDCSTISYIDLTGSKALATLYADLVKDGVTLILTGCHDPLYYQLDRCLFFLTFSKHLMFPTILDAVLIIQRTGLFTTAEPFNSLTLP